ncbi:MAG: radical SAM family heme chaperone HemW [Acidobacteriota bacterium]|nr:radical SAM family heme chaperone HemW [Blastocatellia bacterium]MDW8413418.1 radical SAM family heme chaperone HemW [Acidobacteriota bacterium]
MTNKPVGLYLHIPFCHSRCTYCSFVTGSYNRPLAELYLQSLAKEILSAAQNRLCDTIYLGGGTPSIIPPEETKTLLQACRDSFSVMTDAEITIEINPSDIDVRKLELYRSYGINRASIGIQSFIDDELQRIGRDHTAGQALTAVPLLRKVGFDNISIDLICGLPGQALSEWAYNLEQAFSIAPDHLSVYLLEVKEGSLLQAQIYSGKLPPPDEELLADMYCLLLESCSKNGYQRYEISNFCRLDLPRPSQHNLKYWSDLPYLGFGVSAHSYDASTRYWNVKSPKEYIRRIQLGLSPVDDRQTLTPIDSAREAFMLRLRLAEGVKITEFSRTYGIDVYEMHSEQLKEFLNLGLLEISGDRLRLTDRGVLYSNEVFAIFV